jgi:hypothetical protein
VALKLRGLAQQVKGADVLLTEGLGWVEVRRRVTVDNGRRRRRVGLRGKVDAEALRPSGPTRVRELRGSPAARNRKSGAGYRQQSSGSIPARAGLGVEGGSLGELPGGTAKLLRALAGAGMHRSGRPTTV